MKNMRKNNGVRLESSITGESAGGQKFFDGCKCGVFTVGHCCVALNKKGMAGIQINVIIGVLSSLGHNDPGLKFIAVKLKVSSD